MAIPNIENLSIEILNNMKYNIVYSRQSIINEQKRNLLISKEEERKFQFTIGFAITRLCNLGMIKRIDRGEYIITDFGNEQILIDKMELEKKIAQYNASIKKIRAIAYKIFKSANTRFLKQEKENINRNISERNLCQNLGNYLRDSMKQMRNKWILCRC